MATSKTSATTTPRRLLSERRFKLLTFLRRSGGTASFMQAKAVLGDKLASNLSVMARALEDAGYIGIEKTFVDRMPRTELTLTPAGNAAILDHLAAVAEMAAMPNETKTKTMESTA